MYVYIYIYWSVVDITLNKPVHYREVYNGFVANADSVLRRVYRQ